MSLEEKEEGDQTQTHEERGHAAIIVCRDPRGAATGPQGMPEPQEVYQSQGRLLPQSLQRERGPADTNFRLPVSGSVRV